MTRNERRYPRILLTAIALFFAQVASSEIYQWVDDNGNVQFGDKPQDAEKAAKAKPVELEQSYQPPERTAAEKDAIAKEQQHQREKSLARQQTEQKARQEERDDRRKEKAARCAYYDEHLKRLTTVEVVDGRRQYHYATENGKAVTSERQREIVEELRKNRAAAGCT